MAIMHSCYMLAAAKMSCRVGVQNRMDQTAEVRHQPVIDVVGNIQVRPFAQECSMTHRVESFAKVECDHDNILMCC